MDKKDLLFGGVLLVLLIILASIGVDSADRTSSYQPSSASDSQSPSVSDDGYCTAGGSPACSLAIIDAQRSVKKSSTDVKRIDYLLTEISSKVPESKQRVADMTVNARQIGIDDYGYEISNKAILEDMHYSIPADNTRGYAELVSLYMLMSASRV